MEFCSGTFCSYSRGDWTVPLGQKDTIRLEFPLDSLCLGHFTVPLNSWVALKIFIWFIIVICGTHNRSLFCRYNKYPCSFICIHRFFTIRTQTWMHCWEWKYKRSTIGNYYLQNCPCILKVICIFEPGLFPTIFLMNYFPEVTTVPLQ